MSVQGIQDKKGNNIIEGDFVYPRFRGGSHEGKVEAIIKDQASAQHEGVDRCPKVSRTSARQYFSSHHSIIIYVVLAVLDTPRNMCMLRVIYTDQHGLTTSTLQQP
ncbi:hypothetical protein PEX1_039340 [Penicillium expansum]|uniref:Uncharacterized protein n=1 Tax=Penicillium expansum TaxID=27334 RepID=A0A0A2IX09_PENEN|nr:hypothetical protein PEX2_016060 [Penicillium expansum]KGO40864.1 hypothetical protein PEXP_086690 [Penicillium expansum]KGO44665.1 hypothetical protein PEX1_039340 [Penicillium expansum]KGO61701.1 hypothetical protein PEX2_016060 [Penicillium expansum]